MSQHELIYLERHTHNYHDFSGAEALHLLGELELPDLQEELRDQVWAGAPQHRPHPGQQVGPPRAAGGAQVGGRQAGEGHTLHPGLQGKQGHLITCSISFTLNISGSWFWPDPRPPLHQAPGAVQILGRPD